MTDPERATAAESAEGGGGPGVRAGLALALAFGAAGILPFALAHLDDVDGATYQVIARHVAEGRGLMSLHFLPDFWADFYDHPPLWFWIQAAAIRVCSEAALPWLGALVGLATVAATYLCGRPLLGARAALLGTALLAFTEQFFRYQARPRLDPPLALAYTASVALLLAARGRTRWLVAGGLAAGLGALVKGPPALGAPVSAALALVLLGRGAELKRVRPWLTVAVAALLPAAIFLAVDHLAYGGAWRHGYLGGQLLASIAGERSEGTASRWYILRSFAGGFWPGLPFLALALVAALRAPRAPASRAVLALAAWGAVVLLGFSFGGRAFRWYAMPAFMPLALASGAGLEGVLQRLFGERGPRWALRVVTGFALAALAAGPLLPQRWLVPPCPFGSLPQRAAAVAPPGSLVRLGMAPARKEWDVRKHAGWLSQHSGRDVVVMPEPPVAAGVFEEPAPGVPTGWTVVARHERWALATPPVP